MSYTKPFEQRKTEIKQIICEVREDIAILTSRLFNFEKELDLITSYEEAIECGFDDVDLEEGLKHIRLE